MWIECIQHGIRGINIGDKFEVLGVETDCYIIKVNNSDENIKIWDKYFKEIKEDKTMTKNFKQVIADIKEGEVWESHCKEIRLFKNGTVEVLAKGTHIFGSSVQLNDKYKYTLQRKKVSFTEAFKAREEGKEIESCVNGYKFRMLENGHNEFSYDGEWLGMFETDQIFTVNQIRGEWFINA